MPLPASRLPGQRYAYINLFQINRIEIRKVDFCLKYGRKEGSPIHQLIIPDTEPLGLAKSTEQGVMYPCTGGSAEVDVFTRPDGTIYCIGQSYYAEPPENPATVHPQAADIARLKAGCSMHARCIRLSAALLQLLAGCRTHKAGPAGLVAII